MVVFALLQYAFLLIVLFAAFGFGRLALRLAIRPAEGDAAVTTALSIVVGLGIGICLLQWLAVAGLLLRTWVTGLLVVGCFLGLAQVVREGFNIRAWLRRRQAAWKEASSVQRVAVVLLLLTAMTLLPAPLRPPAGWDELMYHLPHAREWAESGSLVISPWIRYPWFPYNYDLLYGASMLFGNEVLTHLLHAAAGWLTAWLIFAAGRRHVGTVAAALAGVFWLSLTHSEFDNAHTDLGISLFVFAACITFQRWQAAKDQRGWLLASAFLMGVAVGSKYQTLATAAFFGLAVVWIDRRPGSWALALLALAVPCIYWYARNALYTGDPFNPVGGPIFGFSDWNAADLGRQMTDLRSQRKWPSPLLWPAPLVLLFPQLRSKAVVRHALVFCGYSLVIWAISSAYPRYLMPVYPVLALLAAAATTEFVRSLALGRLVTSDRTRRHLTSLVLVVACIAAVAMFAGEARRTPVTDATRESFLAQRLPGYALVRELHEHPVGRIYQFGVEYAIYYARQPIYGDWFGPWRYADFTELEPAELQQKLKDQGFDALLVQNKRFPRITDRPGFEKFFELVKTSGPVQLFKIKKQ